MGNQIVCKSCDQSAHYLSADETSYINYMKPLILAEELQCPHVLSVIDTKTDWAYKIHPERMVPALRDQDPVTGQTVRVFEGTACLYYLADRFDTDGDWLGRTAFERAEVHTWTAYQTAGLGCVFLTRSEIDCGAQNCLLEHY
jgi:glutathione S-transferase